MNNLLAKQKLLSFSKDRIYYLYLHNTSRMLSREYSFKDKELREFLKSNNFATKKSIKNYELNSLDSKKNLKSLLKENTAGELAKKLNISKRTIFNYKKRFKIKISKKIQRNTRNINNEAKLIDYLLHNSIEKASNKLKISEPRIKKFIKTRQAEFKQKILNFLDDFEEFKIKKLICLHIKQLF